MLVSLVCLASIYLVRLSCQAPLTSMPNKVGPNEKSTPRVFIHTPLTSTFAMQTHLNLNSLLDVNIFKALLRLTH